MSKSSCNSGLYKLKLVDTSEADFGGHRLSDNWEALCEAILKDFRQEEVFKFVHPKDDGKVYARHYIRPARYGYAALRVGQFRTGEDYAEVYVNLESKKYEPYVVLLNPSPAFKSHQLLADIVARAFNWVLADKDLRIEMESWVPETESETEWILDCIETSRCSEKSYNVDDLKDFGFEKLMKRGRKRKTGNFRSYIKPEYVEKVMEWLHNEIDDTKDVRVFMRAMRTIARLDLFVERPPMKCFFEEFHKDGLIEISAYNNYMNIDNDKCQKDRAYYDVLRRASEHFGIIV